jgi:O-antigen/teichoic acid export membrane protein
MNLDLARKSVRGGLTTLTSQGAQFFLRISSTAILARLIAPMDYGLIGMVTIVIGFAEMFKDAGLSIATIQKEKITHEQISTLFWLNQLISVVLGLCVMAGSPLLAWFYAKPEITAITAVLSVSFIISGLTIQHQALLRRHMCFGVMACIQIVSQVITLTMTIILAYQGYGYWALVGGAIAQTISSTLLTFCFCPWIPSRMQKGTGVRDMLKFGGHLTGFDFVNYFSRNADNFLIGKYIGADALGLYSRAYNLFMMPITQIRGPLTNVALPFLSSLRSQPERYVKYFQRLIEIIGLLTVPVTMYCMLEAEFLIRILLGSNWLGAVPVFRILAIAGMTQSLTSTQGLVLVTCGYSDRYFYWGLLYAIFCVASFLIGLPFGIIGVASAYVIVNYMILFPSLAFCFHETPISIRLFLSALLGPVISVLPAAFVLLLVNYTLTGSYLFIHTIGFILFMSIYICLSYCRNSVREISADLIRGILK